ncbi:DinB family protein [Croceiramulus getboli]|nr:DinB family protein [Flavobacteriaceae bacterium YJPT1-3]
MFKSFLFVIVLSTTLMASIQAQNTIGDRKGYTPQMGNLVDMLEDLKNRVTSQVESLDQAGTDFLLDEDANRIGAMIYHLAATEKYYQLYTFEGRSFTKEEEAQWMPPLQLGEPARNEFQGRPISFYLDIWEQVRTETLEYLSQQEDEWLDKRPKNARMNNHWAWFHVMEHQANHMGQIALVKKRIPH